MTEGTPPEPGHREEHPAVSSKYARRGGGGGVIYFLGWIGAVIYYVQAATGFWGGVLGILKSLVWPAFLVYDLLKFLAR
jgi:hypothetical protein